MKRSARALALLALPALAVLMATAPTNAAPTPTPAPETTIGISKLSVEDQALALGTEHKTFLIDAATGEVLSVESGETFPQGAVGVPISEQPQAPAGEVQPSWVGNPGCYGPPAVNCFYGPSAPENVSIFGSGTTYGVWYNRTSARSANNDFMACWESGTGPLCSPRLGWNATAYWNGWVTGRAFTIF